MLKAIALLALGFLFVSTTRADTKPYYLKYRLEYGGGQLMMGPFQHYYQCAQASRAVKKQGAVQRTCTRRL